MIDWLADRDALGVHAFMLRYNARGVSYFIGEARAGRNPHALAALSFHAAGLRERAQTALADMSGRQRNG